MRNFIRILSEFYPVKFLLLVFAPFIVGCFINIELTDSRYIIINLIWLSFFTITAALLNKKSIYKIAVVIFFIFGFIEIIHWAILQSPITTTSILVISNSNLQEAIDFLNLKASARLIIIIPYIFLFFYTLKSTPHYFPSKFKIYAGGVILLIAVVFITENAVNKRFIRKGSPQLVKVALTFLDEIKLFKEINVDVKPRNIKVETIFNHRKQTFVLIIGESCNRNHMSLYDAKRLTTPKLQNRKDLLKFSNVVSPYSTTINSVLTILSQTNLENKISYRKNIDIIDVFSSAGFKTYWISNQPQVGIWENMITIFAKKSNYCQFVNTVSNSSMEATYTTSYDSKLFAPFRKVLYEDTDKKFIVLHLMGSHTAYKKRYPKEFNIFSATNKKNRIKANYDNSILYNDFIIDSLLNLIVDFSKSNKENIISAIYLSDHGENVYDEFDDVGHNYTIALPKCNVEIPFLVWVSPSYINLNSQKVSIMRANINKPFVSDDLFHSIIDLNGIQCKYYENKRSIFNAAFDSTRKRILEDGRDYDRKR